MDLRLTEAATRVAKSAFDFLLPLVCVHCGNDGRLLCEECIRDAPSPNRVACQKCGEPVGEYASLCGECVALPPPLDRFVPIFRYGGPARSAVLALKYRGVTALASEMGQAIADHPFAARARNDCIAPVPMHRDRLRERGYNQAELIARSVAESIEVPFISHAIEKVRSTPSQVHLTRQERSKSLAGAFVANFDFEGAHVLLVDDVCTTGNTLMNCASALKRAGARRVSAVVFAKEMLEPSSD